MASYHCTVKARSKGKSSAAAHAKYICREGAYAKGEKAESLLYKESGNMPEWAKDDHHLFWKSSDEFERANGRVYHEIEVALPNELGLEQQKKLVGGYVKEHMKETHPYTFAIHSADATLEPDKKQPHAHIMFSERKRDGIDRGPDTYFKRWNRKDPERGGAEKDNRFAGNRGKENIKKVRESWADHQNRALEKNGHKTRVDHRTLEAQKKEAIEKGETEKAKKLDRPPEKHLGPKVSRRTIRKVREHRGKAKTPEEQGRLIREYFLKHEPTERAIYTHDVRTAKRIDAEIECLEKTPGYDKGITEQRSNPPKPEQVTVGFFRKAVHTRMEDIDKQLQNETDKEKRKHLAKERQGLSRLAGSMGAVKTKDLEKTIVVTRPKNLEDFQKQIPGIEGQIKKIRELSKTLEKGRGRER